MNIGPSDPIDHTDITQGSDLSGMDLTGVDLTSADLSEAYLSNVILAGADLSNADLSGADLTDTTLAGADLSNATLTGADLSNAGLSGADLSDADLINTDLTDATLRGVDLSNATFAGADLTGADLTGTDLSQGKSADQKKSDELLTILQSLYDQLDRVPKSTELPEKYSPSDFSREFGSWDKALKAAGIDKKQAILDEIERVAKKLGHIPTTTDIDKHDGYPASAYESYFDSWDEALQQSGVKERFETKSRESSEEMINTLQSLYNQLDRVPKTTELPEKYSPHDFYTEFGSWDEALKAAGIDKKQALLEDLNQVAEEVGHVPKTSDVDKHGTYSSSVYSSYFDSLDEALQQSGVKERFETESRESSEERRKEMINTLQSLYNQLDRVPKSTELPEKYSPNDFYTEFEGWDEALEAAGIDKEQAILDEIERVAEELGDIPTTGDIHNYAEYPASNYQSHFDSWDEALEQSGVKERFETESRESSEEMINTLQSLYNQLDRVPKPTELPENSKYSPSDFSREFGSWNKALKAAGIDKKQAILDEIERVAKKLGHIPTTTDIDKHDAYPASSLQRLRERTLNATDIDKHDAYPASAYQSYFDSWDEALRESGVKEMFETESKKSSDPIESDGESSSSPDGIERLLEIRGVGRPTARRILETFGTIDEATSAPTHELTEVRGVRQGIAARIKSNTGSRRSTKGNITDEFEYECDNCGAAYNDHQEFAAHAGGCKGGRPSSKASRQMDRDHDQSSTSHTKREEILDEIERVAKKLGHIPSTTELQKYDAYPVSDYQSYFDSWDEALQQSGIRERFETTSEESNEETSEGMINTLQSLYNQLDRIPKTTELPEGCEYTPNDFYTEFGSWDEALEAADIDKKQAILDEIDRVAKRVGHVPTTSDIDEHSGYPASNYASCFDSWDEALRESGVKERFETESRESSDERRKEMINTVQSLYDQLDRVPKSTELPEKYSPNEFYTEFGSWDEALKAAGIDKKQAILDEIERVAKKLGHIPTTTDIHKHDAYPASAYQSYFDSWNEVLRESGINKMFETKSKKSSDPIESDNESPSSSDEIEKLLEIRGVRRPTARRILETFGTIDEATSAPTHELTEIRGVGQRIAARITSKAGRQTGPDHDQPTTTAKSETSPEKKDNDSIEILDEIANEFEKL